MKLRPPRTQRDVVRMLALYDDTEGLDGLVKRFDFSGLAPWALQRIVLGQPTKDKRPPAATDPAVYFKELLLSNTFRQMVLRNVLDAFPDKPRVLFVHVPKCAGTDLTLILQERYFTINGTMENPGWYTPETRLQYLRDIVRASDFVDSFFVRGHVPLRFYVNQALIRPGDQIFTVLRDPVDVVISMVNYVLTRLRNDPTGSSPDTRQWLTGLGMQRLPATVSPAQWLEFARFVMREKRVVADNILCNALGHGDAATAMEYLVASDIEISDVARYEPWLRARWGIPASNRANESVKFITRAGLTADDLGLIDSKVTEDKILYQTVKGHLDTSGGFSIRGRVLA